MPAFTKDQTVFYNAQASALRPVRAVVVKKLSPRKYRVRAQWTVDPLTGADTGLFLGYTYDLPSHHLRAALFRTAQKAPEKQKPGPKPSAYKHIAAFGRISGYDQASRRRIQSRAARDHAPIDAVYLDWPDKWVTIAHVGVLTRMAIEVELNRGSGK